MSFDMNPLDEDPHGECRHEIHELTAENARLRRQVERLVPLVEAVAKPLCFPPFGHYGEIGQEELKGMFNQAEITWHKSGVKKQLDAILADEPGETENGN